MIKRAIIPRAFFAKIDIILTLPFLISLKIGVMISVVNASLFTDLKYSTEAQLTINFSS